MENGMRTLSGSIPLQIGTCTSQTTIVSILIVCLRVGAATRPFNDVYHLTKRRDALAKMRCNMRKINWNPNRFTQFNSWNYLCFNSRQQTMHVWSVYIEFSAATYSFRRIFGWSIEMVWATHVAHTSSAEIQFENDIETIWSIYNNRLTNYIIVVIETSSRRHSRALENVFRCTIYNNATHWKGTATQYGQWFWTYWSTWLHSYFNPIDVCVSAFPLLALLRYFRRRLCTHTHTYTHSHTHTCAATHSHSITHFKIICKRFMPLPYP